jgi:hypothetical protein
MGDYDQLNFGNGIGHDELEQQKPHLRHSTQIYQGWGFCCVVLETGEN